MQNTQMPDTEQTNAHRSIHKCLLLVKLVNGRKPLLFNDTAHLITSQQYRTNSDTIFRLRQIGHSHTLGRVVFIQNVFVTWPFPLV